MLMQLFDLTLAQATELFAIPMTRAPVSGIAPSPEELLDGVTPPIEQNCRTSKYPATLARTRRVAGGTQ
jgi:hypothetical protein